MYCCPCDPKKIPSPYDPSIILSYGINISRFADNIHDFWYAVDPTTNKPCVMAYNVPHPSQVILFADFAAIYFYHGSPGDYYCGFDPPPNPPQQTYNVVPYVAYRHPGGTFNAVYCDGHAETRTTTTQTDWDASQ